MKTKQLSFLLLSLLMTVALSSCNPRKARVLGKVLHEIDHFAEEGGETYQDESTTNNERIYAIKGIYFSGPEEFVMCDKITDPYTRAVSNADGLYLLYHKTLYVVFRNERSTFASEPTLYDIPIDGEAPDKIYHDVSMYDYMCNTEDKTFFFSITNELKN